MKINFFNRFGQILTAQQASISNDGFKKTFQESGILKKIEHYDDDRNIWIIEYFLDSGENASNVLLDLQKDCNHVCLFQNKITHTSYNQWNRTEYVDGAITAVGKDVYDSSMKIIASQEFDLNTLAIKATKKNCYLNNLGSFAVDPDMVDYGSLQFLYKPKNGGLESIEVEIRLLGFEGEIFEITASNNILNNALIAPIFNWANQPYYHASLPLIPQ